ncbi:hypothetical protein F4561_004507 [Lipingzhangella halophila]|uniref:DUF2017 domain-containing protein n=1 Tax=Lipingzhangella halophila TaxID=1783352 RepID=A0A7W7W439_9ACTN|nr:DUF2017 domain-containing protein [Lipingzhangella halophila]MBB4933687.1 hypothetical protein [Lipingzhangella halophila]
MTFGFRPTRDGGVTVKLDAEEVAVLRSMANLVLELVEPPPPKDEFAELVGIGTNEQKSDDPVLARLFPDAYNDDNEAAGDFRRYTEDSLREGKRANAETLLGSLPESKGRITLGPDDAHAWMKSLNDIRLALGTRLEVSEEGSGSFARGNDSGSAALHLYDWLGALQESLVETLFRTGPR